MYKMGYFLSKYYSDDLRTNDCWDEIYYPVSYTRKSSLSNECNYKNYIICNNRNIRCTSIHTGQDYGINILN